MTRIASEEQLALKDFQPGKPASRQGYAEMEVYRTSAVTNPQGDSLKYDITITKTGYISWQKKNYVAPDSLTHQIIN